jgi:DNA-binding transcriptional LysR family regulator
MVDISKLPPLEHLRSFVVFASSPNITTAAETLGISQPLLSKHLAEFEGFVGAPVFEFTGRKKTLTALGFRLHERLSLQLSNLLAEWDQSLLSETGSRPLRIGGRKEILESLVPHMNYEGSVSYLSMESEQVEKLLLEKSLEIGISQKEILSDRLIRKKLWTDEFVLAWNAGIKIQAPATVREAIEKLAPVRHYDYAGSHPTQAVLSHLALDPKAPTTTFSDWQVLVARLKIEKAWSVAPIVYVQDLAQIKTMKLPSELSHRTQFYVYYQKEFSKMPWFADVIQNMILISR